MTGPGPTDAAASEPAAEGARAPEHAQAARRTGRVTGAAHAARLRVPLLATALVALLAGTWLLSGALVDDTDPLLVATGRTAVCCAVLSAFAAGRRDTRAQVRDVLARPGRLALLALLGFAAYAVGTLLAIGRIGTSLTNLVVALLPCAGLAIGALFFGERPRPRQVVGAVIATAATAAYAFVASGAGRFDARGLLLAVAGMLAFALYGFLYRGRMADVVPVAALPPLLGAATLMMIPLTLTAPGATAAQWGGVALLGGAVYAPAYLVQHRLILLKGPVFTAAVQLAVPFTVRLGDWALGDAASPSPAELALLVCGVVGIALVAVDRPGPPRRPSEGGRRPLRRAGRTPADLGKPDRGRSRP